MAAPRLATIGVYGWDADSFVSALGRAGVVLLIDVRQRRGVRGSRYAWANSKRLQAALAAAGIGYEHRPDLAPTTAMRQLQYAADDREGVGKRDRERLAPEFAELYASEVLDAVDLEELARSLPRDGDAALLCVEADPEACHRSLIAGRLRDRESVAVEHLRP